MKYQFVELTDNMSKAVAAGSSGLDIIHGELKNLMLEAERELQLAQEEEDHTEEAMDSMERRYWEGQMDSLQYLYGLTYALSFAIGERDNG
jgi:hypothetical protein